MISNDFWIKFLYFIVFVHILHILQPLATAGHHLVSLSRYGSRNASFQRRDPLRDGTDKDCEWDWSALYAKWFVLNNLVIFTSGPQCLFYQANNASWNSITNGQFKKFVSNFELRTDRKIQSLHLKSYRDLIHPENFFILSIQKDLEIPTTIITGRDL